MKKTLDPRKGPHHPHPTQGLYIKFAAALTISLALLLMTSAAALAATGTIQDDAHVLDSAKVKATADQLSATVDIYTTKIFNGSNDEFDAQTKVLADKRSGHIILDIDTAH